MDKPPVTFKVLVLIAAFTLSFVAVVYVSSFLDQSTRIVFCDVGQGDGAYLRIENKIDILVDTGGDRKILDCLSKYMPFYDRNLEIVFITHPHKDHYGGLKFIMDHYLISRLITVPHDNGSETFKSFQEKLKLKGTLIQNLYARDAINFERSSIKFLWPEAKFISMTMDRPIDPNLLSQVFVFTQGDFDILFTGDYENSEVIANKLDVDIEILKVPHHGSKDGLSGQFLTVSKPEVAVISVGKKNSYGHPHKSTLDILESARIQILRTDEKGNIVYNLGK